MVALLKNEQSQTPALTLQRLVDLDVVIDDLQKLIDIKKKERDLVLKALVGRNVTHEGDWSLVKKETTRRVVDEDELQSRYPAAFKKVAKIKVSVTDLEKVLTEDEMKEVISTKVFINYTTVYDPHGHQA